jgi:prolyl-tRNA synthetase
VVCGRDFTPDGTIEAADVRAGDPCPSCGTGLDLIRGIEIGHIFQLGRRYAEVFGLTAAGPDGEPVTITMGSYGIGLSRLVGVLAEQYRDERGLRWPAAVAPFDVHLVATGTGDQLPVALDLGGQLSARGLRVLVDDRPATSAGVKFTDAELIGIPRTVVVGRRLSEGYVELRDRSTGERRDIHITALVDMVSQSACTAPTYG